MLEESPAKGGIMKKLISGIVVGLLIGLSTTSFAAIEDVVEATFAKFTFKVDGEVKELDADPLVYNGTVYVPARALANMLGKDVVYQANTRTIEFNTPKPEVTTKVPTRSSEILIDDIEVINKAIEDTLKNLEYLQSIGAEQKLIDHSLEVLSKLEEKKDEIIAKGGEGAKPKALRDIEKEISLLDQQINIAKDYVKNASTDENKSMIEEIRKKIQEAEAKKADLESQKAALEAQQ